MGSPAKGSYQAKGGASKRPLPEGGENTPATFKSRHSATAMKVPKSPARRPKRVRAKQTALFRRSAKQYRQLMSIYRSGPDRRHHVQPEVCSGGVFFR